MQGISYFLSSYPVDVAGQLCLPGQHCSAFHFSFATRFSTWDRLMGTIHPDYDKLVTSYPKSQTSE